MRYGLLVCVGLFLLASSNAYGQEHGIPQWKLQRMGLQSLGHAGGSAMPLRPAQNYRPPSHLVTHPPVIYGQRQLYMRSHYYQRDNLKRVGWRIAHRSTRF